MLFRFAVVGTILLGTLWAQDQPCPIQVTEIRPWAHNTNWSAVVGAGDDELDKGGYGMKIQYVNLSDKTIKAVEFTMVTYDAVERERESTRTYIVTKKAKPSQKITQFFQPPEFIFAQVNRRRGVAVWATRILFDDDSHWDTNGKRECFGRSKK
jgi:hypothetical protein